MEIIELIGLELEEIRKATEMANRLKISFANGNAPAKAISKRNSNILKKTEAKLNNITNKLWDSLNDQDAVEGVDIALSKVPMELINREKGDGDYE